MCNTNIFYKKPYLSLMSFDSIVFIVVTAVEGTTGNVACFAFRFIARVRFMW